MGSKRFHTHRLKVTDASSAANQSGAPLSDGPWCLQGALCPQERGPAAEFSGGQVDPPPPASGFISNFVLTTFNFFRTRFCEINLKKQ